MENWSACFLQKLKCNVMNDDVDLYTKMGAHYSKFIASILPEVILTYLLLANQIYDILFEVHMWTMILPDDCFGPIPLISITFTCMPPRVLYHLKSLAHPSKDFYTCNSACHFSCAVYIVRNSILGQTTSNVGAWVVHRQAKRQDATLSPVLGNRLWLVSGKLFD